MKFAHLLATKAIVKEYQAKSLVLPHRIKPFLRNTVLTTQLGFGTYRVHKDEQAHHDALLAALQSGVNLIDTAPIYSSGAAENLIANVLRSVAGTYSRDHFILVSKVGYSDTNGSFQQMETLEDGSFYCLHPEFMRSELEKSLKRLQVDGLDVLLLHNPEEFLYLKSALSSDGQQAELRLRILKSFEQMETFVKEGHIRFYGISCNTLKTQAIQPTEICLPSLLELAKSASLKINGSEKHHFQVIQIPLNPLEHDAFTLKNKGKPSLLELAEAEGLDVLINRPLNAVSGHTLIRLAEKSFSPELEDAESFLTLCDKLTYAEDQIFAFLKEKNQASFLETHGLSSFSASSLFKILPEQLQNEEHWQDILHTRLMPQVRQSLNQFVACTGPQSLAETYLDLLSETEIHLMALLHRKLSLKLQPIKEKLGPSFNPASNSFSMAVLNLLASLPSKPLILCGMRNLDYVKDATGILVEDNVDSQSVFANLGKA